MPSCSFSSSGLAVFSAAFQLQPFSSIAIIRNTSSEGFHMTDYPRMYLYMMYIYIYAKTYIHKYIHTYIHTYMHACIHTCMHTYIHAYISLHYSTVHYSTVHYSTFSLCVRVALRLLSGHSRIQPEKLHWCNSGRNMKKQPRGSW